MPTPGEARSRQTAYLATEHWWASRVEMAVEQFRKRADWEISIEDGIETEVSAARRDTWKRAADVLDGLLAQRRR